jgi:hypothetical protein
MSQILRLEYACTNAEMEQAQSLALRKRLGGGSKWRTYLILFIMLAGALVGGYFHLRAIPGADRVLILAAAVVISVVVVFVQRKFRNTERATTKLEISETDLAVVRPTSKVAMRWSAFCQLLESTDLFVLIDRPKKILLVIPKRAFPDESSQTWFRQQVHTGLTAPPPQFNELPVMGSSAQADRITFSLQLKFRDFMDLTLASWFTWAIVLAAAALVLAVSLGSAANPPENAVLSDTEVFFMFMLPFFFVVVLMIILIFSFHAWRLNAKYSIPQAVALSEESIAFANADGSGTLPWTNYAFYKETWWSFILWHGSVWRCSTWVMLPKRAFSCWDDVIRCRELLERHLKKSRWFRG